MKKITTFLCVFMFTFFGFAQGHETFDNANPDGENNTAYEDGSFTGQDGIEWSYKQARFDNEAEVEEDNQGIMLGKDRDPQAELKSETISNGIGTLKFSYLQPYGTTANLEVYVNDDLVYTAESEEENEIYTTEDIEINIEGDFELKFLNPDGAGQVNIDDIIWTATGDAPALSITSPSNGSSYSPGEMPSVSFNISNFDVADDSTGDGYVQYQIDEEDFENLYSTASFELEGLETGEHSLTMQLVDNAGDDLDPEVSKTVEFTILGITTVNSIQELREADLEEYYTLSAEAVLTYQQDFRNQKYIQDETAAILIDDDDGVMDEAYDRYDGISNITGKLNENNGIMQFQPTEAGEITSSENEITPVVLTIEELNGNPEIYESQLIAINDVDFEDADGSENFETGENYDISDPSGVSIMRTNFFDADYIGDVIPEGTQGALVGLAAHFSGDGQIFVRDSDDFVDENLSVDNFTDTDIKLYPNPTSANLNIQLEGKAQVEIYSLLGQRVISQTIDGNSSIAVEHLNSGVYLIKITQENYEATQKLVIE